MPNRPRVSPADSEAPLKLEKSPAVEVLHAVQFQPSGRLTGPDFAPFLDGLAGDWEPPGEIPLVGQVILDPVNTWAQAGASGGTGLRYTMFNRTRDRRLQIEDGWLVLSWLRSEAGGEYPGYEKFSAEFAQLLQMLKRLFKDKGLGEFVPNMWEMSYVNAVDRGKEHWMDVRDWSQVVPGLAGTNNHLPRREDGHSEIRCQWISQHNSFDGRLIVNLSQGIRRIAQADGQQLGKHAIMLQLTAQGNVGRSVTDWESGLSAGHNAVLEAFRKILSEEVLKKWGLSDE